MNPNNNRLKGLVGSAIRIPLFAALVYAYFCAPFSLERKAFVETTPTAALHNSLADHDDPQRDPVRDLAAASKEARRANKNIFLVVGDEWCGWCHILERFFQEHSDLEAFLNKNYVTMKVRMSQEHPNRAFLSHFPYMHSDPHIFILDARGNLIHSLPTTVLEGGRSYDAKRFQQFLEQFAPKNNP